MGTDDTPCGDQRHTTTSKRARGDSFSQPDSAKRTRVSLDGLRPTSSGLVYADDAWEMSDFSMASQHNRVLSRPSSELSGTNSLVSPHTATYLSREPIQFPDGILNLTLTRIAACYLVPL